MDAWTFGKRVTHLNYVVIFDHVNNYFRRNEALKIIFLSMSLPIVVYAVGEIGSILVRSCIIGDVIKCSIIIKNDLLSKPM